MQKQNETVQHEYRIVPVTRYIVTKFTRSEDGRDQACQERGEYGNAEIAYEVAYALCKREHEILGWDPDDMRIRYPTRANLGAATA